MIQNRQLQLHHVHRGLSETPQPATEVKRQLAPMAPAAPSAPRVPQTQTPTLGAQTGADLARVPSVARTSLAGTTTSSAATRDDNRRERRSRPATFVCPQCKKSFTRKSNLKQHLKIHSDVCDHVCPYCQRGFRQKHSMLDHIRTHTGERPFQC